MTTQTASSHNAGKMLNLFLVSLLVWAIGLALFPSATFAAEQGTIITQIPAQSGPNNGTDDPLGALGTRMENLAKSISKIATPIAILCIVLVLVLYLFAPLLPEIAQANKGYIMRALAIVALIGLIPEIVKFASGLAVSS